MATERAIRIEADGLRLYAVLAANPTADAVWEALPLEGLARLWGEEVYFDVALRLGPGGPAIALFLGRTPASTGDDPVAASPVNVFARITGDAARLNRVRQGSKVRLTRLEG